VLADFAAEHEAGRTPNPCARCNGEIKFGAFLRRADELGIDMVASGHYVRRAGDDATGWRLLRGLDPAKDQSYMLHMLGQRALARSLFPVGELPKAETRALAERFGLPVATKPDSQELCFAPSGDAGAYAREHLPHLVHEGDVVDPAGTVLGRHDGAFAFTIGQRRGTGVAVGERRYVIDVDQAANRVVVGPGELLERGGLVADRFSWIAGEPPGIGPFEAEVRIRYRGDGVPCVAEALGHDRVRVEFRVAQRAVAPGQSAVLYRGDEVLGGGRIVEATR
jgi:tRNA-specific 2-thiouridylase